MAIGISGLRFWRSVFWRFWCLRMDSVWGNSHQTLHKALLQPQLVRKMKKLMGFWKNLKISDMKMGASAKVLDLSISGGILTKPIPGSQGAQTALSVHFYSYFGQNFCFTLTKIDVLGPKTNFLSFKWLKVIQIGL